MKRTIPSILLVGPFLSSAGYGRNVCEDLSTHLVTNGWRVLTTSNKANRLLRLSDMLQMAWRCRGEYTLAQVDVFSGWAFVWAEVVCGLLSLLHKPFVLTLHGGNLPVFAKRWPGRVKRLLNSAVVVTVPSGYLLEKMEPYRQDLCFLPNPLTIAHYSFHIRNQVKPKIMWLRAFHNIYNPGLAPRVISILKSEFVDISLAMVGPDKDGSLRTTQQVARKLGVLGEVDFLGGIPKDDVPAQLNQGDIFINTTNIDNTPVSVMEALACGLCVVSTNVGGIPYLVEHERDALLVEPDDAPAMAAAIRRILTEPHLAEKLSRNARLKAEQYDWSVILPQWEQLLECVVAQAESSR